MIKKMIPLFIVLFGALSFLQLMPNGLWFGIAFAVAGVAVGSASLKRYPVFSIVGILLCILSCCIRLALR